MSEDFSVPLEPEVTPLVPQVQASQDAFYAVSASGSPSPIEDYQQTRADLMQTGNSEYINQQKQQWNLENDRNNKEAVSTILSDETYSTELKKSILQSYSLTGSLPSSLKDRYIQKVAATDSGTTLQDTQDQDSRIEDLAFYLAQNNKNTVNNHIEVGLKDVNEAMKSVGTGILASLPAGFFGLISLLKDHDPELATQVMDQVKQDLTYQPNSDGAEKALETITHYVELSGIPAEKIGDFFLGPTGSPGIATIGSMVLDPRNIIGMGLVPRIYRHAKSSILRIPPNSPLEVTNVANPKKGQQLGTAAVIDTTGNIAEAVGVDRGTIVNEEVFPKLFPKDVEKAHPDLMEELSKYDTIIREQIQEFKYDPNIINATNREIETGKIFQIMKESRTPYYNQSMSLFNETDKLFEGKAVYGRNGSVGFKKEIDAQKAFSTLKESIDQLPDDLKGNLSLVKYDKQYFIEHQWKKEYNETADLIFGKESIQTSMTLGPKKFDLSGISRSYLGRWLFPTGRFPTKIEQGALRGIERAAALRKTLIDPIRDKIATTTHGRELNYLIDNAEELGKDYYSKAEMSGMFPKLSVDEINHLFETHTYWRRQQQYNHSFLNMFEKENLLARKMQGVYDHNGNYLGAASSEISEKELSLVHQHKDIASVWDYETNSAVAFSQQNLEKSGKTLVRMNEKIIGDKGEVYHYGLVGGKIQLNMLPKEVLPRLPGYSGRRTNVSWYVDKIPTKLTINGYLESNHELLRENYTETKAAARTEIEANKIAEQLRADNPDHIIEVRPERTENFGRVMTDYQIHQEFLQHSMKRGERLPSLNGPARIEDRMLTLLNTTNRISRIGAFRAWDEAFQTAFTKGYAKFTKGQFPQYATNISPLPNMGRELQKEYKSAHTLFKFYERMKNNETRGDFLWTQGLHSIADILEKWKIPAEFLRGNHQNPLMITKTIATAGYIHFAPIRQWLVQPAQQLEMYAINPVTAAKNFSNMMAIRMYLGSESKVMAPFKEQMQAITKQVAIHMTDKEFMENVTAIRKSGMLQSVDLNSIVHGVFREIDRGLVENTPERIWKDIATTSKVIPRFMRTVGFDAAELTNRIGNWLQVKDIWIEKNPGKDWKTREAQETIASEAAKLSGAMNRAAQLPYQEGVLSVFFQFAAINQKMLMNLIQDNATILSGSQRARIAAARIGLFGFKYGIPGGAVAYYFIEKSNDPLVKQNAEKIKRGAIDYAANRGLAAIVEPYSKPDLAIGKILSPYSPGFLPYFDVAWETMKLFDGKPDGPRYPAFGMISSFGQAIEDMQGWWTVRKVTPDTFPRMMAEAAEVASGFNSVIQGKLMLASKDKVTRMGNQYGLTFSREEAVAKMLAGIGTQKEEDLWQMVQINQDIQKTKKDMAKTFESQMKNMTAKLGSPEYEQQQQRFNSLISMMDDPVHFSLADKLDVIDEFYKIDRKNQTTINQSIMVEHWKYHMEKATQERQQLNDIMNRTTDPTTHKYMDALNKGKL